MEKIQVWLGDLAEYNNGELVGEWVTLPCDFNEEFSRILKNGNEEWFLGDIDSTLDLNGYSIYQMNEIAEKMESMDNHEMEIFVGILESGHYSSLEDVYQCMDDSDYMIYHSCQDMSDVAYYWYEETGQLAELEKYINTNYIDFEAIGRDMEIEGNFYQINSDTYIQIF